MSNAQTKGRSLLDAVNFMKARIGEAEFAKVVAAVDEPSRKVLQGTILVSEWYPLDVMTNLLTADVQMHDHGDEKVIIRRSEAVIEKQLKGVYKIFVRLGSPEFIIKKITGVHETYFNNVAVAQNFTEKNKATIRYTGFGKQHRIMEPTIIGFYRKALEISGAKNISARFTTPISDGKEYAELVLSWA